MLRTPEQIERALDRVLLEVQKPGRYVGGEYNQTVKDWGQVPFRVALGFPDIYDLGMSGLGIATLYEIVNHQPDMLAERVFLPWMDMEEVMRREGMPLYALESKHPVADFDLLGLSVPYEQLYTNVLHFLELCGLPIAAQERDESHPFIIIGGHAAYNPEPLADFVDAVVVGEGEEIIVEIAQTLHRLKGATRDQQLYEIAEISGMYVPRFYEASYHDDGTLAEVWPTVDVAQFPVTKRIVPVMPPPLTNFIVPNIDTVHNRAPIEIMRGCTRGCRFCHAGMVTRPVRERSVDEVVAAVDQIIANTGYEEIALLSLSSSDYDEIIKLVTTVGERYAGKNLNISLPSLRIESVSVDLMDALKDSKRGGFTFAPEAATEEMRNRINKYVPSQQVLDTAREVYSRGWRTIKLYFMIGHPDETLEDVQAIADLVKGVLAEGRKVHGNKANVNVGVNTFVPKPHTPFQWVPVDGEEQIKAKQDLLGQVLRGPGIKLRLNDPRETQFEATLSRGDRRLGPVVQRAWELGSKFDAWREHHKPEAWAQAFEEHGLDMQFYARRPRQLDEMFPWDHIDVAINKKFLADDFVMSQTGETRVDCREQCFACGILPKFTKTRMQTPADAWECPPVLPIHLRGKNKNTEVISLTPA